MKSNTYITRDLQETQELAIEFAKTVKGGEIFCLYGNLGSGKTSFTQGFAKGLGVKNRIISPTFIIVRKYFIEKNELNFYHIDLYRAETDKDLMGIGLEEILQDENNIVVIEWAEKLNNLLPKKRTDIKFKYINEKTREIEIVKYE